MANAKHKKTRAGRSLPGFILFESNIKGRRAPKNDRHLLDFLGNQPGPDGGIQKNIRLQFGAWLHSFLFIFLQWFIGGMDQEIIRCVEVDVGFLGNLDCFFAGVFKGEMNNHPGFSSLYPMKSDFEAIPICLGLVCIDAFRRRREFFFGSREIGLIIRGWGIGSGAAGHKDTNQKNEQGGHFFHFYPSQGLLLSNLVVLEGEGGRNVVLLTTF